MSAFGTGHTKFLVPAIPKDRRGVLRWVLLALIILAVIAAINYRWVRFQANLLTMKIGSTRMRQQTLQWFIENEPQQARNLFFQTMIEDEELRPLAVEGLLKSDQQQLVPVYLHLWRDESLDQALRDTALELVADHAGRRALFIFLDPSMVLSDDSRYWGLAYDYLNANLSPGDIDFLVSQYYAGIVRTRRAAITALSYLKENSLTAGSLALRRLLPDAMQDPDPETRFRAVEAFGCVARVEDIPTILLHLREADGQITTAAGRLLRYLASSPSLGSGLTRGLRQLALAAANVQEKGYPQEVMHQLGSSQLTRLQGLILCGRQSQADMLATRLAKRTRQILDDIRTDKYFVSSWNTFENSTLPTWFPPEAPRSKNFGAVISPASGKVNYGQILALGAGRVIYCADAESWDRDYRKERECFMLHRKLAQAAGLEQIVRVCVSDNVLSSSGTFLSVFSRVLSASRYDEGNTTRVFEISLLPSADPVAAYKKFAAAFRAAATSAKRADSSIKMLLGTVVLGDRRWYGPNGALQKLLRHRFEDSARLRQYIDGITISSRLSPADLEAELEQLGPSPRIPLWCTGLGCRGAGLRSTTGRLERDFLNSKTAAAELPICISLLAKAGVKAIFFDPLKDTPVHGNPGTVRLDGLLYKDCMPKPLYHTATLMMRALGTCDLASARESTDRSGVRIMTFSGARLVAVAWTEHPDVLAEVHVTSPVTRVTYPVPDGAGNLRVSFLSAFKNKIVIPLTGGGAVIEEIGTRPAPPPSTPPSGDFGIMTRLTHLASPLSSWERSYGSHDRSGGNDDGFSGISSYIYRKDSGEYVIFDGRGPGVLKRFWMGRTADISRIRFYFDGRVAPGIDLKPRELFAGDKIPFKYPLVARGPLAGGGSVSFIPVWFSKRLVIATVGVPRFFQLDYALLNPSAKVKSTTAEKLKAQSAKLAAQAAHLSRKPASLHTDCSPYTITKEVDLATGEKVEVATIPGPGLIKCLRARCTDPRDMAQVLLQVHWDGEAKAGVGSSLACIFGQLHGKRDWRGLSVGCVGGEGYIHYPMPFKKSARVVLRNTGNTGIIVSLAVAATPLASQEAAERYFCCHWKSAITSPSTHTCLLSVKGAGHFVGCVLSLHAPENLSYLDSDILIFADEATRPLLHSTGTDDYFGAGNFYEGSLFTLPYSGLLSKRDGATLQYRLNIADAIPFKHSLRFLIEEPPPDVRDTTCSGTFFWYSESPAGGD